MNFGNNLIKLRKSKGWSQEDLANELDLSRQAISKWELGTTKPDIDNLMKISKLFSISIDELVNNEIVNSDAVSIEVKKKDKKHEIFVWIRRFIIVLAIIYAIDVIYKFSVLFTIAKAQEKYKNLNNYHYVITTYDNDGLKEKEECWFKDGESKTINTAYDKLYKSEVLTYLNFNTNKGYRKDLISDITTEINVSNYSLVNGNILENGQLYLSLPLEIRNKKVSNILSNSIDLSCMNIKFNQNYIYIQIYDKNISLDRKNLNPISFYSNKGETSKDYIVWYNVEFNSVKEIKI